MTTRAAPRRDASRMVAEVSVTRSAPAATISMEFNFDRGKRELSRRLICRNAAWVQPIVGPPNLRSGHAATSLAMRANLPSSDVKTYSSNEASREGQPFRSVGTEPSALFAIGRHLRRGYVPQSRPEAPDCRASRSMSSAPPHRGDAIPGGSALKPAKHG
jgi:hypothetical protein